MSSYFKPIEMATIDCFDTPSKKTALADARRVFIDGNQLIARWQAMPPDAAFVIAETSFSAGLNFLLTWSLWTQYAPASARLHFFSCETHPLSKEDLSRYLAFFPELHEYTNALLANYPILTPGFHCIQLDDGKINLTLMLGDALHCLRELLVCGDSALESTLRTYYVDAWFFDGLRNPQMFTPELISTIGMLSRDTTTIAALNVCENINLDLQSTRQLNAGRRVRHTPWHSPSIKKSKSKHALVLGAGLAGCYTANALARRGFTVTLLDAQDKVGLGASGNQQAILYPKLSSFYSPLNKFMLNAYLFAIRVYKKIVTQRMLGDLSGILLLAYNQKEQTIQDNLQQWLNSYPNLGSLVNAAEAQEIAGLNLQSGGLYMPHSGWIDSPALCEFLIEHQNINYVANTMLASINHDGEQWYANEHHAEVLVIANGYGANRFIQTEHLPLKAIRGQMTLMTSNDQSRSLRIPLCASAHIIPEKNGLHALGATYHSGIEENTCYEADDIENLAKLGAISSGSIWSQEVAGHWAGIRAATPDYLPLVGPIAQVERFNEQFAGLASNSKRWIPASCPQYDGLYVCSGFGSRGLTTIPLSAEWLATLINKEPGFLSRTMTQSLSPARFLRREIIRS